MKGGTKMNLDRIKKVIQSLYLRLRKKDKFEIKEEFGAESVDDIYNYCELEK